MIHRASLFAQKQAKRGYKTVLSPRLNTLPPDRPLRPAVIQRHISSKSAADEKIDDIQDLSEPYRNSEESRLLIVRLSYATAKDEFDIAIEETEKQTVYAQDDRQAAREELNKLNAEYKSVIEGADKHLADQIRQRVGQRIRELDSAVKNMEELAQNQD